MMKVFSSPSVSSSLFYYNLKLMSKVKTITISGKVSEYDVKYTKAYVSKIISAQSDLYQELIPESLPYNTVKEIYVDGILEAELVGSSLLYVQRDPHKLDNQELEGTGLRWETNKPTEEFDEDHALDMAMNNMLKDFTDEEIEEMNNLVVNTNREKVGIYLQSVTSSPPYWVTDTTLGNLEINYSTKNI